jgi:hypothetical protein
VTDRLDYGAWGEEHPILSTTSDNPYRYVGELGYYTHYQDPNMSDSLQLGVRFYDPEVGRFDTAKLGTAIRRLSVHASLVPANHL